MTALIVSSFAMCHAVGGVDLTCSFHSFGVHSKWFGWELHYHVLVISLAPLVIDYALI